jgi:hypothetical protein
MQFRVQANKIQFIRSVYNPGTKRCDQKLVGTMSRYAGEPTDDQIKNLTDDEKNQLSAYLKAKTGEVLASKRRMAVNYLAEHIEHGHQAILAGEPIKDPLELWNQIDALQKALKKAGFKKPAKTAKPAADTPQADLLS